LFVAYNVLLKNDLRQMSTDSPTTFYWSRTAMYRVDDAHLINRAAQALFSGAPSALLARSCDVFVAKATARSWRQGRRRAPVAILKRLHLMLQVRAAECNSLWRDFGIEIARREGELLPPRGFMEVRERDGPGSKPRDGRNRRGRLRRIR
jgi:hypothetical protein